MRTLHSRQWRNRTPSSKSEVLRASSITLITHRGPKPSRLSLLPQLTQLLQSLCPLCAQRLNPFSQGRSTSLYSLNNTLTYRSPIDNLLHSINSCLNPLNHSLTDLDSGLYSLNQGLTSLDSLLTSSLKSLKPRLTLPHRRQQNHHSHHHDGNKKFLHCEDLSVNSKWSYNSSIPTSSRPAPEAQSESCSVESDL